MFKWLGLLLGLVSWMAGLYLTRTWPGSKAMSLSKHAASAKAATKLFAFILIAGGAVCYIWLVAWFVPNRRLSAIFVTLLTLTFIIQIIAALIPDKNGWKRKVHKVTAYSMSVLYIPLSILIIVDNSVSEVARVIGIIGTIYMTISATLFLIIRKTWTHYLLAQVMYILTFEIIILSGAYL